MVRLASADEPRRFSSVNPKLPGEKELVAELRRSAANTQRRPVTSLQQLLLNNEGQTLGGFRYSMNALRQLCRLLGRGLSQAIFDFGAVETSPSAEDAELHDPRLMVRWLNDAMRLRFDRRLKNSELIVDAQERRIDGLVGTRYAYLSNSAFYARTRLTLQSTGVEFHEAVLTGRRLTVRYRTPQPIFTLPGDPAEPFRGGFHFGNSEVGDCSVRTAVLLIRQRKDAKAVSEFSGQGRLLHIRGPQFDERLAEQLSAIIARAEEPTELAPRLQAMRTRPLGLVGTSEAIQRRTASLVRRLQSWGLHKAMAQRVMARVEVGTEETTAAGGRPRKEDRTEWDLFNAMTFIAKRQQAESQERLEQLAYQLVSGRKSLA